MARDAWYFPRTYLNPGEQDSLRMGGGILANPILKHLLRD